jgi:putative transposon-encoded protein
MVYGIKFVEEILNTVIKIGDSFLGEIEHVALSYDALRRLRTMFINTAKIGVPKSFIEFKTGFKLVFETKHTHAHQFMAGGQLMMHNIELLFEGELVLKGDSAEISKRKNYMFKCDSSVDFPWPSDYPTFEYWVSPVYFKTFVLSEVNVGMMCALRLMDLVKIPDGFVKYCGMPIGCILPR